MSSRIKQREEARAQREAQEQARQQADRRRQRIWLLGGTALVAVVVVVALVLVSSGGKNDGGNPDKIQGTADIQAMLTGIPQQGQALGKADRAGDPGRVRRPPVPVLPRVRATTSLPRWSRTTCAPASSRWSSAR